MARGKKVEVVTNEQKEKLNQIKHTLCIAIKNIERTRFIPTKQMAYRMGTTASRLSEVQRLQYEKLTLNQLFNYLIKLDPNFEMQILYRYHSSAELAMRGSDSPNDEKRKADNIGKNSSRDFPSEQSGLKTEEGFFEN